MTPVVGGDCLDIALVTPNLQWWLLAGLAINAALAVVDWIITWML